MPLGLGSFYAGGIAPETRDFQNDDATPVQGVKYIWIGTETWVGANVWKG